MNTDETTNAADGKTPRCDAANKVTTDIWHPDGHRREALCVRLAFAQELERELAAATAELDRVRGELARAQDRAERLYQILVDISEETDLRNIRGTIQHALKEISPVAP